MVLGVEVVVALAGVDVVVVVCLDEVVVLSSSSSSSSPDVVVVAGVVVEVVVPARANQVWVTAWCMDVGVIWEKIEPVLVIEACTAGPNVWVIEVKDTLLLRIVCEARVVTA